MRAFLVLVFLALFPTMAFAHPDPLHAVGFLHGVEHPMGGLDHILAMVAVGVFAFLLGGRALWLVPLSFVAMMVVGFALGLNGVDLPFVELGIALSSVVIGGAAALKAPLPVAGAMALVGIFAVFHGHAHGAEMPESAGGLLYAAGFVTATMALHGAGVGAALLVSRLAGRHGATVARVAGGVFALGGLGVVLGWL